MTGFENATVDLDRHSRRAARAWIADRLRANDPYGVSATVTSRGIVLGPAGGGVCAFSSPAEAEAALFGAGLETSGGRWRLAARDAVWVAYAEARLVGLGAHEPEVGSRLFDWQIDDTSLGRVLFRVEPRSLSVRLIDRRLVPRVRRRALEQSGLHLYSGRWDARFIGDVGLDVRREALELRLSELQQKGFAYTI